MARRRSRCPWGEAHPLYVEYHDEEWGVPLHDDTRLFEMLVLEGAQAGLSWLTVLKKREHYRRAFSDFDPRRIARYDARKVVRLLANEKIIRNRLKIEGAVRNARVFLATQDECGTFDHYLWDFVGGKPKQNAWTDLGQIPARTAESDALSNDLKRRGFLVRRFDNLLRLHAGDGNGERPPRRLLPLPGRAQATVTARSECRAREGRWPRPWRR